MTYVLLGNYGVGNLGDEALRDYFLASFPSIHWKVVSARPYDENELPRLPGGLRSLFSPWWKVIGAIARSDGLVFGGGTLFTDIESVKACFLWHSYVMVARLFGKDIFFAFQGVGPFRTGIGESLAKSSFKHASYISTRDPKSFERVNGWMHGTSFKTTKIVQTFDPVFSFVKTQTTNVRSNNLIIIPRSNSTMEFYTRALNTAKSKQWDAISILLMQSHEESYASNRIKNMFDKGQRIDAYPVHTIGQLIHIVKTAGFVLTQRYHGAICAMALDVPYEAIPMVSGDKLDMVTKMDPAKCDDLVKTGRDTLFAALGEKGSTPST
ncbi:MAG: polysaccharide pyruvyl transferase family protein [Candidatus Peribacteraceae bacterium]|nr:polysaccharide pyruvyl transferase family protein [Candidatus Peribacteraceae bacterium]